MNHQEPLPGDDETLDTFFHGRIRVLQKKKGYRFSVDAPLLADFIETRSQDEVLELGTGCGIISLLLSIKPFRHLTALEIQVSLFDLALRNIRLNKLEERISILNQDLKTFDPPIAYDVVFSNPPYFALDTGHLSQDPEKSAAKHELKSDISAIMRKTAECLQADGRAYFIYPEKRREKFMKTAKEAGLHTRRLRPVLPRAGERPHLFLSECAFSPTGFVEMPPLVLMAGEQQYSEEAQMIFAGRSHV